MSGEKTEQPTSKKLRDARKRGQVAHSKEVGSTALLISLFALVWMLWPSHLQQLQEMVVLPAKFYDMPFEDAVKNLSLAILETTAWLTLPFLGIVIGVGIAANYFQIGPLFSLDPIKPELKKLNPIDGLKKIFSKKNLFEFVKSLVKVAFLGLLLYLVIRDAIPALVLGPYSGIAGVLVILSDSMFYVALYSAFAYVVIAAADYFFQRRMYTKELMMSKAEVKQEYKEMEGDPHIKAKRKQLHREMVMNDTVERTRKATVLVTNPEHIAVAIQYDKDKNPLPVVTAMGVDHVARRMMEVAREENIPIMRNVPLARDLFEHADVNQYIPSDLIEPIAELLRWVEQLSNEQQGP